KENISAPLRISRSYKSRLLRNYEIALRWLTGRKSAIRDERTSCAYLDEETHLRVPESSQW
ncbi:hypothetical protein HN011_002159, partial [Eciton burchellii]